MSELRILLVDDNRDLIESFADVLEDEGHEVTLAYNGEEAVAAYASGAFDLTFMDIKLPGMNGFQAFGKLRKFDPGARVVMMTGYRIEQLLEEAIEDGAVAILRNPFSVEQVFDLVQEIERAGIILVAGDDPDFCEGIEQFLGENGYRVLVARTGREAVETVAASRVDVLVLDLRLPVLDGLGVYLELKGRGREVPTIIVTGYRDEEQESIDTLRSLSVTGCLFKPFHAEELLAGIERLRPPRKG